MSSYLHNESQTLTGLFESYLSECQHSKGLRSETIKSYRQVFQTFQKVVPEVWAPADIGLDTLNVFFSRLHTRERTVGHRIVIGGIKASTIKTYYNKLIVFFRWLERYSHLQSGLSDRMTKPPNPVYDDHRALTNAEVSKIMAAISLHTKDDVLMQQRDMLIISLGIYSGLRRGELLGLRLQDVDFHNRTLFVDKATSKSKKSRHVPLHPLVLNLIRAYFSERKHRGISCDRLIISLKRDTPLTIYGLKHWVERYRKISGVRFHMHQTRHTFACSLALSGAHILTVMKVLGHASVKTTQTYTRSIESEQSRAFIERLHF